MLIWLITNVDMVNDKCWFGPFRSGQWQKRVWSLTIAQRSDVDGVLQMGKERSMTNVDLVNSKCWFGQYQILIWSITNVDNDKCFLVNEKCVTQMSRGRLLGICSMTNVVLVNDKYWKWRPLQLWSMTNVVLVNDKCLTQMSRGRLLWIWSMTNVVLVNDTCLETGWIIFPLGSGQW